MTAGRRARATLNGQGLITQAANAIAGTSSLFSQEIAIGDRLIAGGIDGVVTAITSNVLLTVSSSATVAVGVAYTIIRP